MSLAESLHRLQQLDNEIQAAQMELASIAQALADSPAVQHARAECARLEQALRTASSELKLRELDAQALAEKIAHEEHRLYGGLIRSPKEILDVERELSALRRRREALDEELLGLMERVEQLQEELQQCRNALRQAEQRFAEDSAALRAQQTALQGSLQALLERRQALAEHLSPYAVQQYGAARAQSKQSGGCAGARWRVHTVWSRVALAARPASAHRRRSGVLPKLRQDPLCAVAARSRAVCLSLP